MSTPSSDTRRRGVIPPCRGASWSSSNADSLDSQQTSTSDQLVGSGSYRDINLRSANIFIHELEPEHWPLEIHTFVDHLFAVEKVHVGTPTAEALVMPDTLKDTCVALAHQASRKNLEQEIAWMDFHKLILGLFNHENISWRQGRRFDVQVGPSSDTDQKLSTPVPDLIFGLAVSVTQDVILSQAPTLSNRLLAHLVSLCGIQSFPTQDRRDVAYPCVIFEAESDAGSLLAAENKAALAAAQALSMLETLKIVAQASYRLPAIVICTQGSIYEVFVAFDLRADDIAPNATSRKDSGPAYPLQFGVHLVQIWLGDLRRAEAMYQFQRLWYNVTQWILNTWRPTIIGMLDAVKATIPD
ncbi:hypothetical protein BCV69DRAFT_279591 [Microstroma glucosiphilum]|uniref:Uncharacterized protein n=1 Tax=Pseudomicrostroma glucosiphilum TaxID=1684307 RepID=A0A316UH50_9BASI|nr:hypothetical protein BCV69DRAFT_279591 [Pseudomicrostroma glucosiphilum]PWN23661.1 hypothetical protein BCV69DRAFT_279591 [Pseudomicrostroma glucosiphilum]